jgi:hypothetical protein
VWVSNNTQNNKVAYNLPVEEVLADHDGVDACGVLECQKGEAARAARRIPHDGARVDLAKLRKVRAETV